MKWFNFGGHFSGTTNWSPSPFSFNSFQIIFRIDFERRMEDSVRVSKRPLFPTLPKIVYISEKHSIII